MENGRADFFPRLEEALAQRATWLETTRIPELKDLMGTYRSLFEGMTETLIKKGLLRQDPYDYDGKVSDITVPSDSALSESGDTVEVGRRIVAYRRQIDFLADTLPFSLVSLDLAVLKRISSLLSYLDWGSFGESSHSPTTRALARLVTNVRLSKDGLSSRVLQETQTQIERLSREIGGRFAELEAWNRESWKAEVRAKVLPRVSSSPSRTGEERTAKTLVIRKAFEEAMPGSAWHPQLVQEILGEDNAAGSADRMERLLVSLAIPGTGDAETGRHASEQGRDTGSRPQGLQGSSGNRVLRRCPCGKRARHRGAPAQLLPTGQAMVPEEPGQTRRAFLRDRVSAVPERGREDRNHRFPAIRFRNE